MASRTITNLTDDIDGSDADETVTFTFKGTTYEIDLSKKNLDKMVRALQPYTTAAAPPAAAAPAPAAPPAAAPTKTNSPRFVNGPAPTASRSPTEAASAPPSKRPTTPPTEDHHTRSRPSPIGWAASRSSSTPRFAPSSPPTPIARPRLCHRLTCPGAATTLVRT